MKSSSQNPSCDLLKSTTNEKNQKGGGTIRVSDLRLVLLPIMEAGEVPILVGLAGVGKTTIVKEIANELEKKLIILTLSQMEPGDLIGLPVPSSNGKTKYLAPDWWPSGDAIIFLDEINRSHPLVRSAVMQLLIDKRIHTHVLPPSTWIVAAMNPSDDGYEVSEIFDEAFIDRFVWIKVEADFNDWQDYMELKGFTDYTLAIKDIYLTNPKIFYNRDFNLPRVVPTPRALERFAKLLEKFRKVVKDDSEYEKIMTELGEGVIGESAALVVSNYLQLQKIDTKEIFENPERFSELPYSVRLKAVRAWVNEFMRKIEDGRKDEKAMELEKMARTLRDIATKEEILAFMKEFTIQPPKAKKRFKEVRKYMYSSGMKEFNSLFLESLTSGRMKSLGELIYEVGGEVIC